MRRIVILAVVGIVALGAVCALIVYLASAPPAKASMPPLARQGPTDQLPIVPPDNGARLARPSPAEPPNVQQQQPRSPAPGDAEATPLVTRPRSLGAVGLEFDEGLGQLQPRLSQCWDAETKGQFGASPRSSVAGTDPGDESGGPVLMLELETRDGAIDIVDAPVDVRNGASVEVLACLQGVLLGQTIPVPDATAGSRYRWPYTVQR